jgi:uncharacterized protein
MNILFVSSGNKKTNKSISPIIHKQGESIRKTKNKLDYFTIKGKGIKGYILNIIPLYEVVKSKNYDIIHAHFGLSAIVCHLSQLFRIKKTPFVISLMGSDLLEGNKTILSQLIDKYVYWIIKNKSNHIIVKSQEMYDRINIPGKSSIIPNGVDFDLFKPLDKNEIQKELNWSKKFKHILFAADPLRPVKNYQLSENALERIKDYNIEIHHLVNVKHDEIPKLMNAADVVILSSLFEGSPNVIKESMACNTPIVSTKVGDVSKLFDNVEGCFLSDFNEITFSNQIKNALKFNSKNNSREKIEHLREENIAKKIIAIYSDIKNKMGNNKKILVYFGHPAQYLFMREAMKILQKNGSKVKIVIKTKDVLEDLVKSDGFEYTNILQNKRGNSKLSIILSLLRRNIKLIPIILNFRPDLMISTDATIAQLGKLFRIQRITITEDDYDIIKPLANVSYPITNYILCPEVCSVGRFEAKKIGYKGYMKLAYLHPNVFKYKSSIFESYSLPNKYALIRLAQLTAFHDKGIKGISNSFLDELISQLSNKNITPIISSEYNLGEKYDKYILSINPKDIHHILKKASILICDSQSMSVEAAMLGTPSLRYSSFAGKISVLEELENKYQLTYGFNIGKNKNLIDKLNEILNIANFEEEFEKRKEIMLSDKINVTKFLVWLIEFYPKSAKELKQDSSIQNKFK